jgi:CBS domain-containing protein
MLCQEVMKREVHCVSLKDTVEEAARRMRDANIGFLPVCDQAKKVIGALTDRDIAIRVVAAGKPTTTPVEAAMTRQVVACRPSDDLEHAQGLMAEGQKSRIMCLDADGHLVGVISLSDIAQHEDDARASDTFRQVTEREVRA